MTPSYFSREPQFNDLYIRISRLLTKYHHLPTLPASETPQTPWVKLDEMRSKLGEPVKASHFAKVMRVAKRLNLIEPSLFPQDVKVALDDFKRDINPFSNVPSVGVVDKHGRAVGVGKRKESTARAWVVEGNGEVLINGKTLSQAFGRVHDRESAIWALQATERLDKYNVWALVEGGGVTGQAEALTLAVAKALIIHEPALKTALRKGKCSGLCHDESFNPKTNLPDSSWLHHKRPENCGEEEARPCQGAQDAGLGQAISRNRQKADDAEPWDKSTVVWGLVRWMANGPSDAIRDLYCTVQTIVNVVLESQDWRPGPILTCNHQQVTSLGCECDLSCRRHGRLPCDKRMFVRRAGVKALGVMALGVKPFIIIHARHIIQHKISRAGPTVLRHGDSCHVPYVHSCAFGLLNLENTP